MTLEDYLRHYLDKKEVLIFFGYALIGCLACVAFVLFAQWLIVLMSGSGQVKNNFQKRSLNAVQRFYDIVFSGASILSFLAIYYLIDRFLNIAKYRSFWDENKDFLLLLLIVLSIIFNNILDRVLVPLRKVSDSQRASLRVAGMIYVILIFVYIKYVYENNNYDGFIMYFLGLVIGRFIYFDASLKDFINTFKDAVLQLPIMLVGLAYTAFMCYIGFDRGYLLKSNGVLVSTFFAHLFMIVAIFIFHHSHIILLITKGSYKSDEPKRKR